MPRGGVKAEDIGRVVTREELEVTIILTEPSIDDVHDIQARLAEHESERLRIAMRFCGAFDIQIHKKMVERFAAWC